MKKIFVIIFALAVMLGCCFTTVSASTVYGDNINKLSYPQSAIGTGDEFRSENAYFKDEAELFTDTLSDSIFDNIQETANKIDMNIAVYIGGVHRSDSATESFTANSSEALFGNGEYVNSIFLYLDFEGDSVSYDYIDTFHDARLYITESDTEDILDDMYDYLPASGETVEINNVVRAIEVFLNDIEKEKSYGANHNACYYNREINKYRYSFFGNIIESKIKPYRGVVLFFVIALISAIVTALVFGNNIKKKYKFRESQNASTYTSNNRITFRVVQDNLLGSHVSKHKIQSDGGGSHGGHGGGGGGSHGGGGRHR